MRRLFCGVTGRGFSSVALLAWFAGSAAAQTPPAPTAAPEPAPAQPVPVVPAQPAPAEPVAPAAPQPVVPATPAPAPEPVVETAPTTPAPAAPIESPELEPLQPGVTPAPASGEAVADAPITLEPPPVTLSLEPPPEVPASPSVLDEDLPWYSKLAVDAFVDAYFSFNFQGPKPQDGRNRFRAYDVNNGFSIAWAGLNLGYSGDHFGGVMDLRFGPSARALAGADADAGLENLKQAYATWRPGGAGSVVTLDFGKFDTIYGAEVAESQLNFNYTRGLLYWLGQPAFHTGLRANFDVNEQFWITALLANGWNNSVDNNAGKSLGLQLNFSVPGLDADAAPALHVHLGYLVGPEGPDYAIVENYCEAGLTYDAVSGACVSNRPNSSPHVARDAGSANVDGLRHLIDLVLGVNPTPELSLLLNLDVGFDAVRSGPVDADTLPGFINQSYWGLSAAGRYQLDSKWALALRGEIYSDPDGLVTAGDDPYINDVLDLTLYSATLTAELVPVPNLILRWDNRIDVANEAVFPRQLRSYEELQATSTLGVVVVTN